ncbi:MAG TPA: hypothetical protein VF132_03140 [Rudaea sp.]
MLLDIPDSIESAPRPSQALLAGIRNQLGLLPNLHRLLALSPAALGGFSGILSATSNDGLSPALRVGIALAVAEANADSYGVSMHRFFAGRDVGLSEDEIAANRSCDSHDPQRRVALRFVLSALRDKNAVPMDELEALSVAGFTNANVLEILQHVAFNTWSAYIAAVAALPVDFPLIVPRGRSGFEDH